MNERRQGSVRATTVCFVFCLSREDLNVVLNQFPTLRASLEARARERLQELYLSEKRPLETILALFSDPEMDTQSAASESTESEISDILRVVENGAALYPDSEGANQDFTYNSSIMNTLPTLDSGILRSTQPVLDSGILRVEDRDEKLKTPSPESCHSITTPSTGTFTTHYHIP